MDWIHTILNVEALITSYGYVGIFIVVFLESGIFFPLPGDSLLFASGIAASHGYLDFATLFMVCAIATFTGSIVGYAVGRKIVSFHKYAFFRHWIKQEYIDKAHQFFEKHGSRAIMLSRFVTVVRTFIPIAAGIAEMDKKKFILWNIAGSLLWSFTVPAIGYFLGQVFPGISDYLSYLIISIIVISALPFILPLLKKRKSIKK